MLRIALGCGIMESEANTAANSILRAARPCDGGRVFALIGKARNLPSGNQQKRALLRFLISGGSYVCKLGIDRDVNRW